jgi:hypothetical protein
MPGMELYKYTKEASGALELVGHAVVFDVVFSVHPRPRMQQVNGPAEN